MTAPAGRVLVTGGSGFVGGALIERLVADGRHVAALARSPEARDSVAKRGAEPVPGDVLDPSSLTAATRGTEVVYHVAGVNAFCPRDPAPLMRVNVEGSVNVIRAAHEAGVGRVIHTSSAATLGEVPGTIGRESSPHRGSFLSHYERSKFEAERAVFAAARPLGIEVVSVNPSSVQGPGRSGGTARLLVWHATGKLKVFVRTRISLIDVVDCAAGHILAERKGRPGERYVLNGAVLGAEEALALLGRITGAARRPRIVPARLLLMAAGAVEGISRVTGREPPLCREMVRGVAFGHAYDGSKAERELGLRYTPIEETLRRTLRWLVDAGKIPREAIADAS
ncbi:NAD-dependent epimerase/dehydratase family protein [soil metagenome]